MFKKTNRKPLNTVDHSATLNFQIKEAYKTARTNLVFSVIKEGCKKIVVTSSLKSEGKTTTAVNLAIALAQQVDTRVLIIDCDLRKPKVDRFSIFPQRPALQTYWERFIRSMKPFTIQKWKIWMSCARALFLQTHRNCCPVKA